ncbi:hypothetical protein [Nocardia sp. NPDC057030]|uniref:hypothetical protein n=1 Tax=unclassified Nocardia TaxID=2637762 RepID=UPI00363CA580
MSAPRPPVDPAMQAWIDDQKSHFQPSDMDAAVRLLRGYERADRERQRREGEAA